jgi:hypothetical protein
MQKYQSLWMLLFKEGKNLSTTLNFKLQIADDIQIIPNFHSKSTSIKQMEKIILKYFVNFYKNISPSSKIQLTLIITIKCRDY